MHIKRTGRIPMSAVPQIRQNRATIAILMLLRFLFYYPIEFFSSGRLNLQSDLTYYKITTRPTMSHRHISLYFITSTPRRQGTHLPHFFAYNGRSMERD